MYLEVAVGERHKIFFYFEKGLPASILIKNYSDFFYNEIWIKKTQNFLLAMGFQALWVGRFNKIEENSYQAPIMP